MVAGHGTWLEAPAVTTQHLGGPINSPPVVRRRKQMAFNEEHGIIPRGVVKRVRDLIDGVYSEKSGQDESRLDQQAMAVDDMSEKDLAREVKRLEKAMLEHAKNLEFEKAARVRDQLARLKKQVLGAADLVTEISDKEQGILNVKGVNIIRHRPFAGIRIWGARTIASDPLWNYINVRRLFLMVERSVRDAIQWAVFLPNVPSTRGDLKSTIAGFLYRLWKEGALDGATWQEAFTVQCDQSNNPDVDVRSGLLTVDVQMRPVFPAEFIRVRFRQSPMRSEVSE